MNTPPSHLRLIALELPRSLVLTLVVNLLCAVIATFLLHAGSGFTDNLVIAMCIGIIATLLINGGRILVWGKDEPGKSGFLLMLILLAPLSVFTGNVLAACMLGRPQEALTLNQTSNTIAIVVLALLACVGGTLFYRKREKSMALASHDAVIEKQAVQAQLQMLQAQIEPHMLFNTLAALQPLISSEPLRAQQMLDQLIHYLHATLSASRGERTSLGEEFELIKAYLGLMSLRMGMRLTYKLQLPDELRRIRIPPMLLQPLVENAIRHGLEPKPEGGDCTVCVTRHQDLLVISVFDTGTGLDSSVGYNHPDNAHPSLNSIRARLDALYGPLAELTLTHHIPAGTVAQIAVPMGMLDTPQKSVSMRHHDDIG